MPDTQCGFKGFRREAARDIFSRLRTGGIAFDAEVIFLARRRGYSMVAVPVMWHDIRGSRMRIGPGSRSACCGTCCASRSCTAIRPALTFGRWPLARWPELTLRSREPVGHGAMAPTAVPASGVHAPTGVVSPPVPTLRTPMVSADIPPALRHGSLARLLRRAFGDIPRPDWDRLYAETPAATPFASWTFHRAWWDAFATTAEEHYLVRDEGAVVAIVPLMVREARAPQRRDAVRTGGRAARRAR